MWFNIVVGISTVEIMHRNLHRSSSHRPPKVSDVPAPRKFMSHLFGLLDMDHSCKVLMSILFPVCVLLPSIENLYFILISEITYFIS